MHKCEIKGVGERGVWYRRIHSLIKLRQGVACVIKKCTTRQQHEQTAHAEAYSEAGKWQEQEVEKTGRGALTESLNKRKSSSLSLNTETS